MGYEFLMLIADLVAQVLGTDLPVRIECYDGSSLGPADAPATLVVRSRDALAYIVTAPGELGFARAYVSGALDVEGDIFAVAPTPRSIAERAARCIVVASPLRGSAGVAGLRRPPIPAEEARLQGVVHSKARDAAAIAHHYDVSNDFYRLVLGPSMTYSCAVWEDDTPSVDIAQTNKYELICRKLGLRPGMRLLDVGCGWGGMGCTRPSNYDVSRRRCDAVAQAGRVRDRRRPSGPGSTTASRSASRTTATSATVRSTRSARSACSSTSGCAQPRRVLRSPARAACDPSGRVLNHGISRTWGGRKALPRRSFINRYVFPDGQLHEVGAVVSRMQHVAFEVRHVESLREHYALTLRSVGREPPTRTGTRAVALVGPGRARVWRLYMAASAINFESGRIQVHQILAVPGDRAASGMPRRPDWDTRSLSSPGGREHTRVTAGSTV